ncbi:MAG: DegT/DnrJ/EryC1/StrS family aminotransferase [Gemmatirosa sp.]
MSKVVEFSSATSTVAAAAMQAMQEAALARPTVAPPRRRATFLPFSPPSVGEEEVEAVTQVLRSDWITTGPVAKLFERRFAAAVEAPEALAVNSCTAALHTALAALDIGRGDEVITTTMTFAATANVIEHVGARPVLVDVEPDTLNLDPARVATAISPRTRAIIPVHFGGHPAALDAIDDLAAARGIPVLEDAAHAVPAAWRGRPIGADGRMVAFSFYATKNLTTAEGGMLTGPSDFLAKCRVLALHGMSRDAAERYRVGGSWSYEVHRPGFKYNMPDIQAAIGLVQLQKLSAFAERRHAIVAQYHAAFADEEALETPVTRDGVTHAWHLYPLRLRLDALRIDRARFIQELTERNIGTSVHFIPVHLHPFYQKTYDLAPHDFPVAYANYLRLVSLPLHPRLTDAEVHDVIEAVYDVVARYRR